MDEIGGDADGVLEDRVLLLRIDLARLLDDRLRDAVRADRRQRLVGVLEAR